MASWLSLAPVILFKYWNLAPLTLFGIKQRGPRGYRSSLPLTVMSLKYFICYRVVDWEANSSVLSYPSNFDEPMPGDPTDMLISLNILSFDKA